MCAQAGALPRDDHRLRRGAQRVSRRRLHPQPQVLPVRLLRQPHPVALRAAGLDRQGGRRHAHRRRRGGFGQALDPGVLGVAHRAVVPGLALAAHAVQQPRFRSIALDVVQPDRHPVGGAAERRAGEQPLGPRMAELAACHVRVREGPEVVAHRAETPLERHLQAATSSARPQPWPRSRMSRRTPGTTPWSRSRIARWPRTHAASRPQAWSAPRPD